MNYVSTVTAVSLEDIALSAMAGQNIVPLHSQSAPSTDMVPHDPTEVNDLLISNSY